MTLAIDAPSCASITSIPTRRFDGGQSFQIKIGHRLQSPRRHAAVQTGGEPVQPGDVLFLECEQFGYGSTPPLWAGTPVDGSANADDQRPLRCQLARAVMSLPFRIAERALAGSLVILRHAHSPLYNVAQWGQRMLNPSWHGPEHGGPVDAVMGLHRGCIPS